MKLTLQHKFTIEIDDTDEVLTGAFIELDKKGKEDAKKIANELQKKFQEVKKLEKLLSRLPYKIDKTDDLAEREKLEKQLDQAELKLQNFNQELIESNPQEEVMKFRFNRCITSPDMERLKEIADMVTYTTLMQTIMKDIADKEGKSTKA